MRHVAIRHIMFPCMTVLLTVPPQIVIVKDVGSDIPTDGNTEWTAVTLQLPCHDSTAQLAYILFCKGVSKAEASIYSSFYTV